MSNHPATPPLAQLRKERQHPPSSQGEISQTIGYFKNLTRGRVVRLLVLAILATHFTSQLPTTSLQPQQLSNAAKSDNQTISNPKSDAVNAQTIPPFLSSTRNAPLAVTKLPSTTCQPQAHQPLVHVDSFPQFANLTLFFDVREQSNNDWASPIICEFQASSFYNHFAHTMQQLYGCFAYWQEVTLDRQKRFTTTGSNSSSPWILLMSQNVKETLQGSRFSRSVLEVFQNEFGVTILSRGALETNYSTLARTNGSLDPPNIQTFSVHRGYVISQSHILTRGVQRHFNLTQRKMSTDICTGKPRIGILNRRPSSGRHIQNAEVLVDALSNLSEQVEVEYFEHRSFPEQVAFFQGVDILISPHGAQLTGLVFLSSGQNHCRHVLEIFPPSYILPSYYGSLAINSKVGYSYLYLNPTAMVTASPPEDRSERMQARAANLCLSPIVLRKAVLELMDRWQRCCQQ